MSINYWATGLVKTLKDSSNHIISSNLAVVICDKYPKAKHHYLVLPHEDIPSIFHLNKTHMSLLEEMYLLALNIIETKREQLNNFKIGFHNQPSMYRLHMHVISKDFVSECLKTKKHWNSFNTPLFITYEDLYQQLEASGQVICLDKATVQELNKQELKCNQCDFEANNIPTLKQHLEQHFIKSK